LIFSQAPTYQSDAAKQAMVKKMIPNSIIGFSLTIRRSKGEAKVNEIIWEKKQAGKSI
jgi:hypothetical protein